MTAPMVARRPAPPKNSARYRNKAAVCFRGLVGDRAANRRAAGEHMEAALGGAASTVRAQTSPSNIPRRCTRNATDTAVAV